MPPWPTHTVLEVTPFVWVRLEDIYLLSLLGCRNLTAVARTADEEWDEDGGRREEFGG